MEINRSNSNRAIGLLAGLVLLAFAPSSFAASTWSSAADCAANASFAMGNTLACGTNNTVNLTAEAFSAAAGSAFAAASVSNSGASGLGVQAAAGDQTAIDNSGSTDAIRLKFTNAAGTQDANFNLTSLTLANVSNGADVSVFAWVGTSPPAAPLPGGTILGKTTADVYSGGSALAGWTSIGNFTVPGTGGTIDLSPFSALTYSSYWLVSAYDVGFGGTGSPGNDSFTVTAMIGDLNPHAMFKPAQVPEPGSLALVGLALGGLAIARRRRQQHRH